MGNGEDDRKDDGAILDFGGATVSGWGGLSNDRLLRKVHDVAVIVDVRLCGKKFLLDSSRLPQYNTGIS